MAGSSSSPVALDAAPREDASLATIVHTDNKLFNKVILIFAHLCIEAEALKTHARQHILPPLLVLNEETTGPTTRPETEGAALLPLLFEMQVFMQRANALTINLLHQLASLYESKQRLYVSTFKAVKLRRAFEALGARASPRPRLAPAPQRPIPRVAGELFAVVISIDALIGLNPRIGQGVRAYVKLLGNMRADPARYGTDLASLDALERRADAAERELCNGPLFPALISQPFDVPGQLRVSGNNVFKDAVEEHSAPPRALAPPRPPAPAHARVRVAQSSTSPTTSPT